MMFAQLRTCYLLAFYIVTAGPVVITKQLLDEVEHDIMNYQN